MDHNRHRHLHAKLILSAVILGIGAMSCTSNEPLPPAPSIVIPSESEPFRADTLLPLPDSTMRPASDMRTIHGIGADSLLGTDAREYLAYHLVGVARRDYDVGGIRIRAEVAQFASPMDAYGYYSQQRPVGVRFSTANGESFQFEGSCRTVRDRYVLTAQGFNPSDSVASGNVLRNMQQRLLLPGSIPLQFMLFPTRDMLYPTTKYYSTNFLDIAGLDSAFAVDYAIDGDTITMFLIADPQRAVFARLNAYAERQGYDDAPSSILFSGGRGVVFEHPRLDCDVVFGSTKLFLIGIINFDEDKHSQDLAKWVQGLSQ